VNQFQIKMAASKFCPGEQAKELLGFLESSNLHYAAQVTPFSLYITVRKKFRKTFNFVTPDLTPSQPSENSIPNEALQTLKRDHEMELKQKGLEYHKLKVAKELLAEKVEKIEDCKLDLCTGLDERSLECHELKNINTMLQDKIQKADNELKAAREDKETQN
jgi:hypothetical protein